ncbi:MAG: cellulase family glycosylhydrolase [Myxococcota bacterium]|nr:cellulase family glycosylhydrolase [Myxococcota bacterium]
MIFTLLISCQSSISVQNDPKFQVQNGILQNDSGKQALLRGFNARINGIFDVTFDDGRIPLEAIPVFEQIDCQFFSEQLGLNLLRLPVNWSGIEPEDDVYNEEYLDHVFRLVDACYEVGVYSIIDIHQDAYSKEIGEDGAPLWAIYPPPEELLEGPLEDLEERRASAQVLAAFSSLYRDEENLHQAYGEMALRLADEMQFHPGAIALELQNEPVALGQVDLLYDFYDAITEPIRQKYPDLLIVFEPDSVRNFTDFSDTNRAFGWDNAIYSPHIYTDVFENGWASQSVDDLSDSIETAQEEAVFHNAPLFVGEFGHAPHTEAGFLYIETSLAFFDQSLASWAFWVYEEYSTAAWGLYEQGEEPDTRGPLREDLADLLARPFPEFLSGELHSLDWDVAQKTLTVSLTPSGDGKHLFTAPLRAWPQGARITCDGENVTASSPRVGRIEFLCKGQNIVAAPVE